MKMHMGNYENNETIRQMKLSGISNSNDVNFISSRNTSWLARGKTWTLIVYEIKPYYIYILKALCYIIYFF